jgi:hypothetical protein
LRKRLGDSGFVGGGGGLFGAFGEGAGHDGQSLCVWFSFC